MFNEPEAAGFSVSRTWVIFFEKLFRGAPGAAAQKASPGPFWRTFRVKNSTIGDDVGDNVPSFGATVGQMSTIRRITAVLRKEIESDLIVRFRVKYPVTDVIKTIGTFTLPASTPLKKTVVFTTFTWDQLPDKGVIIPDIVDSDGSKDKNGIAAWTIEWMGRGAGQAVASGLAFQGDYDNGTTYAAGDIVHSGGDAYISLVDDNQGNDPASSPAEWGLFAAGGDDGAPGAGVAAGGTAGQILVKQSGTNYDTDWEDLALTVGVTLDGGGSAIPTGIAKRYTRVPNNCEIVGWTIIAHEGAGSISIDVCAQANSAPPSAPVLPDTTTDKISASAPIALSAAQTAAGGSSAISTWSKTRAAWDVIGFNVTSVSGVTWAHVLLHLKRLV
jgi:hypothetical protein